MNVFNRVKILSGVKTALSIEGKSSIDNIRFVFVF